MTTYGPTSLRPESPVIVHNLRRPWRWRLAATCARFVTFCSLFLMIRFTSLYSLALVAVAFVAVDLGLLFFGPPALRWNSLDRVTFGDDLRTRPYRLRMTVALVRRIEVAPAPGADYDDEAGDRRELTVVYGRGWRWPMLVPAEDADRVIEWAREKAVPVVNTTESDREARA